MNTLNLFAIENSLLVSLAVIILSLCVGSFLNVVIHHLPIMLNNEWTALSSEYLNIKVEPITEPYNLIKPNSTCPKCKSAIKPWHNIPVISYLFLKGKCATCKNPISIRYPLVEAATAILSFAVFYHFGFTPQFFCGLILCWCLIALTMIDFDTQLLPDSITIPLIWLGLLINIYEVFTPLATSVLSAAGAYIFLWLFVRIFKIITGKDGMGEGDFKLFAAFGAWFGYQALPLILVLSSMVGAIIGLIILKISNKDTDHPLAFGPYLCMAAYFYLLYGNDLIQWYLGFYY